ncbi:hypothetical protein [Planctomycetes bacterium K23_9]|uniref:Virginiamycin B lyase n=1 Tax=Stieleria marina TaxID=1930275 RepID=A0A517NVC5_9BACT|nr:Virginiamycin B lyase [Planctomycetes bacterium K23_9]
MTFSQRLAVCFCVLVLPVSVVAQDIADGRSHSGAIRFAGVGYGVDVNQVHATPDAPVEVADRLKLALGNPFGVEIIGDNVWITTVDDQCIWKTSLTGQKISRIAGARRLGYDGDGGPADQAAFNWPHEVRVDDDGNLFIADTRNHVIRRVDGQSNIVTTIAGNGAPGFAGEGDSGTKVQFDQPHSVVLDHDGGLLVADTKNHRLRRIDLQTGIVKTIAGNGQKKLPTDGSIASDSPLYGPRSLAVDAKSIWIALREGNSIWRLDREKGTLHHVAGTGKKGYTGDGGDPREATFSGPKGIAAEPDGNLLVVDTENHAIRRIDFAANKIVTVMGGTAAAETTTLKRPHGIAVFVNGFMVGDSEKHRVVQGLNDQPTTK